jgi:phosphate starvation-inducible PhoH-like protein
MTPEIARQTGTSRFFIARSGTIGTLWHARITPLSKDNARRLKRLKEEFVVDESPKKSPSLRAITEAQAHYLLSIRKKTVTFGIGPAGTGKTYIAAAMACDALVDQQTDRIIMTRPVFETGRTLGFLPGDQNQKYAPYVAPLIDNLSERMGRSQFDYAVKSGKIRFAPLEMMRGASFDNCWIVLDEAQNTTPAQMKMVLTRIGQDTKLIVNGDPDQTDISGTSGLMDAVDKLQGLPDVGVVDFELDDIVRSGIVREILVRYARKS